MRKVLFILILSLLYISFVYSQDPVLIYKKGIEVLESGKYRNADKLFDKVIELEPEYYYAWFQKGLAKSYLRQYQNAIQDFSKAIEIKPDYIKAFNNRGIAKKNLADYKGAIEDYNIALSIDSNYSYALYNRGIAYDMLDDMINACKDWRKALSLGLEEANNMIKKACTDTSGNFKYNKIAFLLEVSQDPTYGYNSENPIKIGVGKYGGEANQKAYLNLLRDAQDNPIKYKRIGSCCIYNPPDPMFILGVLDIYKIKYKNEKGRGKVAKLYLTFYEYKEPKVVKGLRTVVKKL